MSNVDIRQTLDPLLKQLDEEKTIDVAEKIIAELVGLLGIKVSDRFLLNVPRIDAELSRFMLAPGFGRQAAAYDIPNDHADLMDLKLFWIKKTTKTNLSWLIGITPNFEDSDANDYKNISIDFIFPESADRLIILISDKFKIRSLELKDHVTHTQFEIFSNWENIHVDQYKDSLEAKQLVHLKLWESFNFEPINRAFYLELVESFSLLVHHLEKSFGRKPAVMFTTRLIGRLLFLWFLKKKNYVNKEPGYFDVGGANDQAEYYKSKLEILFFEVLNREISERENGDRLTPYLNGGLFDINQTDFYKDPNLTFPAGYFSSLFHTLNKYNFTVDESSPEFQHVAIDPEMLGRIFESLLAEQVDEASGSSKKKATGAYYTPREIVSYMCEESLIEFLKNKIPDTPDRDLRINELVRLPETIFRDQDQNKRRDWKPYADPIIEALSGSRKAEPLAILDPAVGSGAFPMGMLHLLVKVYSRLDAKYEKNISKLKRDILSKSLYGVDIEQTAIEICRLRAWLSIVVDIPEGEDVDPLPNLDFKFACANTLIPLHTSNQASLLEDYHLKDKLMEIRDEYFMASKKDKKLKLQMEYEKLCSNEDLFDNQRTKQLKSYKPFDIGTSSSFYDPELHHGVSHFDIVIANPPYVDIKNLPKDTVVKLFEIYKSTENRINLYSIFIEKSMNLLKDSGNLTYITPNSILIGSSYKKIRHQLIDSVTRIIKLPDNIFEKAVVETIILRATNGRSSSIIQSAYYKNNSRIDFNSLELRDVDVNIWKLDESYRFNIFTDANTDLVIRNIDLKKFKEIGKCFDFSLGITPYDSYKGHTKELIKQRQFHSDSPQDETYVPLISGANVGRYKVSTAVKEYLSYGDWLGAPRRKLFFTSPRVIVRQILSSDEYGIHAGYTEEELYHTQIGFSIIETERSPFSVKVLCALLNSRIINFYHKFKYTDPEKDTFQKILIENTKSFPIPTVSSSQSIEICNLVDSLSKVEEKSLEFTAHQNKLDLIFYRLYGLSYEDVLTVDTSISISKLEYVSTSP